MAPQEMDSDFIINTLFALEAELIELRRQHGELPPPIGARSLPAGRAATKSIRRSHATISSAFYTLLPFVAESDARAGRSAARSIGELGTRAILLVLAQLVERLREVATRSPRLAPRLLGGRFSTIDGVAAFVIDSLSEIWSLLAAEAAAPGGRGAERHRVLREVRRRMINIAEEPDFRQLLRVGLLSFDWPSVGHVCVQLAGVLRLDMQEPTGRPFPIQPEPSTPVIPETTPATTASPGSPAPDA